MNTKKLIFVLLALAVLVGVMAVTTLAADDAVLEIGTKHELVHHEEIPACHVAGTIEYWYCPICQVYYKDAVEQIPCLLEDLGIAVDCDLVYVPAAKACHANGKQEYWFCPECEAVYSDAEGKYLTNHLNLTIPAVTELVHVPAAEACHANGKQEYWFCPDCEAVYSDAEGKYLTNHLSLTIPADCELVYVEAVPACHANGKAEYWYCAECEAVFTDAEGKYLTNHLNLTIPAVNELTHVEALEPTCAGLGNQEHWFCEVCDAHFADAEGHIVTNALSVILPATGEHNMTHTEAVAPTCDKEGNVEYWYCDLCQIYYQDAEGIQLTNALSVILPAAHTLQHVEALEPTCAGLGNIEYWFCEVCNIHFADAEGNVVTNSLSVILPATGAHNMTHTAAVEAACHQTGLLENWYCDLCHIYYLDAEGTQLTNAKSIIVPALQDLVYVPAAEACHVPGIVGRWVCNECQAVFEDIDGVPGMLTNNKNLEIPADCELIHVEKVAPTATENGCEEYWYCPECEAVYADAEGKLLTNRLNLTIPATGEEKPKNPETADLIVLALAALATSGMGLTVALKKKEN